MFFLGEWKYMICVFSIFNVRCASFNQRLRRWRSEARYELMLFMLESDV